jgi:hypothetical protein
VLNEIFVRDVIREEWELQLGLRRGCISPQEAVESSVEDYGQLFLNLGEPRALTAGITAPRSLVAV